jgi:hypothetical protein
MMARRFRQIFPELLHRPANTFTATFQPGAPLLEQHPIVGEGVRRKARRKSQGLCLCGVVRWGIVLAAPGSAASSHAAANGCL